jgi:hypothetical protein
MAVLYRDPLAPPPARAYAVKRGSMSPVASPRGGRSGWEEAVAVAWGPAAYRTEFRALWSPSGLFARFDCTDDAPWHTLVRRDDPLWEEEVVEIFIQPDPGAATYIEIEISPANVVADLLISQDPTGRAADIAWDFAGLETAVVPWRGRGAERAPGWTAIASLPWDGFRSLPVAGLEIPPRAASRWRFNVFRIKRPFGPGQRERDAVYAAWSVPDGTTFHALEAFRDLVFE